jgi:hypothetical protein
MKIFQSPLKLIAASAIATCAMGMIATPSHSQTQPAPAPTAPLSNDWKDYGNIEQGFMQGCIGKQLLPAAQKKVRQEFCQCALLSYKNRYAPQSFMQMNALANELGDKGPALVNLMMRPEMDVCFTRTGFRP